MIYSLDHDQFQQLKPVHGLIFLFKWVADDSPPAGSIVMDSRADNMFFAKQVINNACATQAILSVLLNVTHPDVDLGTTLGSFKEFVSSFDSTMKGLALSNSEEIRSVHNSFSRQSIFELDSKVATKDDDVFHFVSYVPIDGRLYELDGLREGPIDHGPISNESEWLDYAAPIIEQRMAKYQAGEIHFNLMGIIQDKLASYNKQLQHYLEMNDQNSVTELQMKIAEEEEVRRRWRVENVRRRHNYLPFIVELLKSLASKEQLLPVYQKAKEKAAELDQKRKEKKQAAGAAAKS